MVQNIQTNGLPCDFVPDDPPGVLPVHYSINQCQQYISMTTDVTRLGLCNAIRQYIECVSVVDGSALPVVWKGILGRNAQMWQKRWYLDCHMAGMYCNHTKTVSQGYYTSLATQIHGNFFTV